MLLTADFETTTIENDCRVWAYGFCEIGNPSFFEYGNSIDDFFEFLKLENHTLYFHNLKFDGEFILCWLFEHDYKYVKDKKDLESKCFNTLISDKGQFYSLEIVFEKKGKHTKKVMIYDSLKILPFSVMEIAKGFNLPSKKELDYIEFREKGHVLNELEKEYLYYDVMIPACALHVLFEQGLTKMTQGSNALFDYKRTVGKKNFERWFPIPSYDQDVRQSYKGGFTYLNPRFKDKDISTGIVLDVNSLYPSVMYYNPLPYGEGIYFEGKYETDKLYNLYIQMFTCQFEVKENYIPTLQLKNNLSFIPTEYLTSSNGDEVTLCLTSVDLELFLEHYDVYNITWHSGWKFKSTIGLFKDYIDKWIKVKIESTLNGNKAMRTLAKLMLNALYGKFALNPNVCSKIPTYYEGLIKYLIGEKETRDPIYIPVGTFVTAWARYKTISSAQKVYDRFIYADTDSLHLVGTEIPEGLDISDTELGMWKHESTFTKARFLRQKTYVEYVQERKKVKALNTKKVLFYKFSVMEITCAGMPKQCYQHVTWDNFKCGSSFDGKLQPKHVKGGIILKEIEFTIKQ
jgi:hypothetical protein